MDAAGHAAPLRSTEKATTPFVVGREAIEALRSVVVDGRTVSIGEVRDFREHPALAAFLPEAARPSFAWTRLAPGETHHAHTHPIAGIILTCSGGGRLVGDATRPVSAGDAVCVPGRRKPRLRRGRPRYELPVDPVRGAGLFEDGDAPPLRNADARAKCYARMEAEGRQRWRALVVETINPTLAADAVGRFWSYVKRWSMRFQHLLYARQITVDFAGPSYQLFRGHLREEFDHDPRRAGALGRRAGRLRALVRRRDRKTHAGRKADHRQWRARNCGRNLCPRDSWRRAGNERLYRPA
jgi:hypothetical protein